MVLWLGAQPLVLASQSTVRRAMLTAAGVPVEVRPADLDERGIERQAGGDEAADIAALLAREKALSVAKVLPGRVVAGADQTLALGDRRFSKPTDRLAAAEQLRALRGRTHALHSAVAVAIEGRIAFVHVASAHLHMRNFSEEFLTDYLDAAGETVFGSVGGYQLEGLGSQLFAEIEGDYFTVLGLPLLALLEFLRRENLLAA
jgi:septum formation protein